MQIFAFIYFLYHSLQVYIWDLFVCQTVQTHYQNKNEIPHEVRPYLFCNAEHKTPWSSWICLCVVSTHLPCCKSFPYIPPFRASNSRALKVAGLTTLACLLIASQVFTAYIVLGQKEQIHELQKSSEQMGRDLTRSPKGINEIFIDTTRWSLMLESPSDRRW